LYASENRSIPFKNPNEMEANDEVVFYNAEYILE
jgi:hypothetical protein